ncbi:MAG: serine/threonine-protein kinase [Myxococcota bacterium]
METPTSGLTLPYGGRDTWVDLPPTQEAPAEHHGALVAGAYRILEPIGGGSGGQVFRALHEPSGVEVALKVMHRRHRGSTVSEKRFERETRTASRIQHPHIVRMLDAGMMSDGTPWQAMELLEGCDLATLLQQRPLGIDDTVQVGLQLLSALHAVHSLGYVHRDIKPENVFLVRHEEIGVWVKLLDFGIVKPLVPTDSLPWVTEEGLLLGTPQFMAPEQITGDIPVSVRTDVWAVGAVLYNALTGAPPFEDPQLSQLLVKIAREPAPSVAFHRPDAPTSLVQVVARALRTHPDHRYESAKEMAAELARVRT